MPRRRINPKKKSVRKREVDEWLQSGRGQALLATLELQESCPELTHNTLRRRQHFDESTNSFSFDLSGCSMSALPAFIDSWKMSPKPLTAINLSACTNLTALPVEIGEIKSLRMLNLTQCSSLAALPDSIGELEALRILHLTGCVSLTCLPNTMGQLKALSVLDLAGCASLSALPGTINGLEALELLSLEECSSVSLSRDALNGLVSLKHLGLCGCVKIDALALDGLTNLKVLDATSVNLGLVKKDILALHKRRVKVQGFSVRKMMRELRNQAERRRQRRLCDFCGRQGSIAEPRLPVCYCGRRRYCDENCQRADWGAGDWGHSETCSFGFLTAVQIELLQKAEDARSKGVMSEVNYRALRDDILARRDLKLDGDSDHDDSLDGSCDSDDRLCGFTPSECDELLAQGVKPWDADAGAVLAALGGGDDSSSDDSAEMEKIQAEREKVAAEIDAAVAHQKELQDALDAAREQAIRER